eukprot:TRINITY_DN8138_c0_g1_i1.p1 TRINITY_DN8138_c0_g1~~TRINITY_DN8138_c0_g1_i1.p1  ORF type:complete len:482 (-),score=170.27 TRINITY_DN8138_c0_g1_i1:359-1804(-)
MGASDDENELVNEQEEEEEAVMEDEEEERFSEEEDDLRDEDDDDEETEKAQKSSGGMKKRRKSDVSSDEDQPKKRGKGKLTKEGKKPKEPKDPSAGKLRRLTKVGKGDKGEGEPRREKQGEREMWDRVLHKEQDSEDDVEGARTKDDDDFIDDTGVAHRDEREDSDDERGSIGDAPQADEAEEDEEEGDEVARMLKGGKKRKKTDRTPEETAMLVEQFMAKLEVAWEADGVANREGQPAINKLRLLPELVAILQKKHLQTEFLDRGILTLLKNWLEPLPDGSLPNITIRSALLTVINELPIDMEYMDRKEQLKDSGLGRIIMFFSKLETETVKNRKLAQELVHKWSRPIVQKSTRYEDIRTWEETDAPSRARLPRQREVEEDDPADGEGDDFAGRAHKEPKPGEPGYRIMARIPQPVPLDFVIRPKSKISEEHEVRNERKKQGDEKRKKMEKTLKKLAQTKQKNVRAEKVSVEGRGMTKYI